MERDSRVSILLVVGMLVAFPVASTAYSGGAAAAAGDGTSSTDASGDRLDSFVFDGLVDAIQELDELLEAVVDLLRTIERLFGAGEGGGD